MTRVIGVRFRTAGKIYYFDPGDFEIKKGDHVIVETARGIEFGTVLCNPRDVEDEEVTKPLKGVLRMANDKDVEQEATNRIKEKEAFRICKEKIIKHGLEMKLIDAEYTFDNNKVLFYFTADGRIDFRELVKDLASEFKTRIELRQIGVRDETKIIGGYGICGRPLCCHSYLSDFIPVSIKMAKEQNLSLNPTKISGVCGRLMCCLKNEEDVYEELNRKMPGVGDIVASNDGLEGEVASVNILRQTVRILVDVDDEKEVHEYHVDDITFLRKKQKHKQNNAPKEKDVDEEALKALEQEDISGLDDDGNAGAPKANKGDRNRDRKNNDRRDRQNKQNKQGGQNRQNNQNPQDAQNAAGKDNNQNNQNSQNNQPGKGAAEKENAQNNQGAGVEAAEQKGQNDGDNRKKKNRHGGNRKNFNRNGNKGGGKPQGQKGNQDGNTKA